MACQKQKITFLLVYQCSIKIMCWNTNLHISTWTVELQQILSESGRFPICSIWRYTDDSLLQDCHKSLWLSFRTFLWPLHISDRLVTNRNPRLPIEFSNRSLTGSGWFFDQMEPVDERKKWFRMDTVVCFYLIKLYWFIFQHTFTRFIKLCQYILQ